MIPTKDMNTQCAGAVGRADIVRKRAWMEPVGFALLAVVVAGSAIVAKESGRFSLGQPLVAVDELDGVPALVNGTNVPNVHVVPVSHVVTDIIPSTDANEVEIESVETDKDIRWFNGRPVRTARTVTMRVTAYAPDRRSCGPFADGITATLHSVETNDGALVAADPKMLSYGSMLTVPGYDNNQIVPVLDCGGAIKGNRLDVLFPTHNEARRWGVRDIEVVVWEYADGLPVPNVRTLR